MADAGAASAIGHSGIGRPHRSGEFDATPFQPMPTTLSPAGTPQRGRRRDFRPGSTSTFRGAEPGHATARVTLIVKSLALGFLMGF